jgi:hypothetical protein
MPLPEFTVAIWNMPHRAHGHLVEIDASLVDDGLPGGVVQSFGDVPQHQAHPEVQHEFPHREFVVTAEQVRSLVELADRIEYSFKEHPYTPMLGGSFFGLRVSRGYQVATIVWQGKFHDQDEAIRTLYDAVQAIASA